MGFNLINALTYKDCIRQMCYAFSYIAGWVFAKAAGTSAIFLWERECELVREIRDDFGDVIIL